MSRHRIHAPCAQPQVRVTAERDWRGGLALHNPSGTENDMSHKRLPACLFVIKLLQTPDQSAQLSMQSFWSGRTCPAMAARVLTAFCRGSQAVNRCDHCQAASFCCHWSGISRSRAASRATTSSDSEDESSLVATSFS